MSRESLLELAKGMREAADWIEANADLPMKVGACEGIAFMAKERDDLSKVARALGSFRKADDAALADWYFIIRKSFGPIHLEFRTNRNKVCKKVKVMKEVDEWECADSILAPELPEPVLADAVERVARE